MQNKSVKKVLITGASRGVGQCIAHEFAKAGGADLILVARDEKALRQVQSNLQKNFPLINIQVHALDLTRTEHLQELFIKVPLVDILVNNAGVGRFGSLRSCAIESQIQMIRLNCEVPLQIMKNYLPGLEQSKGSIVNIASLAGIFPVPFLSVYSATKAFIIELGRAMAYELKDQSVRIVTVCPGGIKTDFYLFAGIPHQLVKKYESTMSTPQEIAKCVVKSARGSSRVLIPGFGNQFIVFISRWISRSWMTRVLGNVYKRYLGA